MFDWLFKIFGRDRNVLNEQQLAALISGLNRAASASLDVSGEQHSRLIEQYFNPLEGGALEPRKILLKIDDDNYMLVPLISLVPPISFRLDTMRMRISVKLAKETLENVKNLREGNSDSNVVKIVVPPHSFTKGKRRDYVDILLEFRSDEPPATVRQMLNAYSDSISVQTIDKKEGFPKVDYANTTQYLAWLKSYDRWKTGMSNRPPALKGISRWFQKISGQRRR